jgi:hypothetical protein
MAVQPPRAAPRLDRRISSVVHDPSVLAIDGQMAGDSTVMTGKVSPESGSRECRRTWTPKSAGMIEELRQTLSDAGRLWASVFAGIFRRIAE